MATPPSKPPSTTPASGTPPKAASAFAQNANPNGQTINARGAPAADKSKAQADSQRAAAALQSLERQRAQTSFEEAAANRRRAADTLSPNPGLFSGYHNHGSYQSFSLSLPPVKMKKAILKAVVDQLAQGNDTIYFYHKNKIHPGLTKMATELIEQLQGPGGKLEGCGIRIAQTPMKTLEPFRSNFLGSGDREKASELRDAAKAQAKGFKEASKLLL